MIVDKEKIERLATGDYEKIPFLELDYEEWLALQHFWMRERLGSEDGDPLSIALEALDRIARRPINGSGVDVYYIARMALEKTGAWPVADDD